MSLTGQPRIRRQLRKPAGAHVETAVFGLPSSNERTQLGRRHGRLRAVFDLDENAREPEDRGRLAKRRYRNHDHRLLAISVVCIPLREESRLPALASLPSPMPRAGLRSVRPPSLAPRLKLLDERHVALTAFHDRRAPRPVRAARPRWRCASPRALLPRHPEHGTRFGWHRGSCEH